MLYLKQSTASQAVLIGPFVDSTDGATAETGLTIANTDIRLSKAGANIVAKNSGGGTHDENGFYQITLDATDTNTVGPLQLHCLMSGALMVHAEFYVVEESVYDKLFASSAALNDLSAADVNAQVDTALTDIHLDHLFAAAYDATSKPGNAAGLLNEMVEDDSGVTRFTVNALENGPSGSGASAASIADAVWDEALSGHTTAGTAGKAVADIETDATAILDDTGTAGVVVAGTLDVNVSQISGDSTAADNLEASAKAIVPFTTSGTPTTTNIPTGITEATTGHYNGRVMIFTSGPLAGQATDITGFTGDGTTGTFTVTALTEAPAASVSGVIV